MDHVGLRRKLLTQRVSNELSAAKDLKSQAIQELARCHYPRDWLYLKASLGSEIVRKLVDFGDAFVEPQLKHELAEVSEIGLAHQFPAEGVGFCEHLLPKLVFLLTKSDFFNIGSNDVPF
jgi:hypothetical protein